MKLSVGDRRELSYRHQLGVPLGRFVGADHKNPSSGQTGEISSVADSPSATELSTVAPAARCSTGGQIRRR